MPRYFFDFTNGNGESADAEGSDHADLGAAEGEAIDTLIMVAREGMPSGTMRAISVRIRDESGKVLGTYELSLTVTRHMQMYDF
jgi:hypothetical protein